MNIKQYKKITNVLLKDGRILISEQPPIAIYSWLKDNSHIMIEGEMHSKFSIISATESDLDDSEGFILSQPADIQQKLREKIKFRKTELGIDTSLNYIKNYVKNFLQSNS